LALEEYGLFDEDLFVKQSHIPENLEKIGLVYMLAVSTMDELELYMNKWLLPNKDQINRINLFVSRILQSKKDKLKEELMEISFHILPDRNPIKYNSIRDLKLAEMQVLSNHIEKYAVELSESGYGMTRLQALKQRMIQDEITINKGKPGFKTGRDQSRWG